jgi:hypothetical protein
MEEFQPNFGIIHYNYQVYAEFTCDLSIMQVSLKIMSRQNLNNHLGIIHLSDS